MNKRLLVLLSAGIVIAAAFLWWLMPEQQQSAEDFTPLKAGESAAMAALVSSLWRTEAPADSPLTKKLSATGNPVYVAARRRGRRLAHAWSSQGSTLDSLRTAIADIASDLPDKRTLTAIDTLEVVFAYDFQPMNDGRRNWSGNIFRGVRGLEIHFDNLSERYSPTSMLATNRDVFRLRQLFISRHRSLIGSRQKEVKLSSFAADQWLLTLPDKNNAAATAVQMERGNVYVPMASVTAENTRQLARLSTDWLSNNLHPDGRMTYKFWPSPNIESDGNNMIRQWMATVAMIRAAKYWQDEALMRRAADNIAYNLEHFYSEENGFGLIEWENKVKLGAVALAALALAEHPQRERWHQQEQSLQRTIEYLWQPTGAFVTFYKPAKRNDVQNFYPGEALLYWATLYEQTHDAVLLDRIMTSFRYYRAWHLKPANRNPAFIPWHTQAYYKIWKITHDDDLRQFIFEMNDWLITEMQQTEKDVKFRDAVGRFYNPRRPYGPPHVSSTGVYMEGLIDAFAVAMAVDDQERQKKYRTAIQLGLRNVMQLQFVDDIDMYYVPKAQRERVRGGMRTTLYNNEIRCDNVQHNLMAILKILSGFEQGDYGNGSQ